MGPEGGLKAVQLLRPRITIPQDVDAFRETVANKTVSKCLVHGAGVNTGYLVYLYTRFVCEYRERMLF